MKIGFDVSQTGMTKAGCGFFAENLLRHLAHIDSDNQYILYPTFGNHFWDNKFQSTLQISQSNFKRGYHHSHLSQAQKFWHQQSNWEKKIGNIDILHSNNFFCPPNPKSARLVYTLYDLSFLIYPDCTTEHNRTACFEGVFQASLYADLIITISQYSRNHFLSTFPHYPSDRVVVAYPASRFQNHLPAPSSLKLDQFKTNQFWLNVGTIEPRKNIRTLLHAYARYLSRTSQPYPLVLAGQIGWMEDDILNFINQLGIKSFVHLTGYLTNEELQWLYQNCFGFVYPSLFEGFGLPVLEAMTLGAPVITSNVSSLPEITHTAGILINPIKEDEITAAMLYLMAHPEQRTRLKASAIQQAALFSWEKTAKQVLASYQDIMARPKYYC